MCQKIYHFFNSTMGGMGIKTGKKGLCAGLGESVSRKLAEIQLFLSIFLSFVLFILKSCRAPGPGTEPGCGEGQKELYNKIKMGMEGMNRPA